MIEKNITVFVANDGTTFNNKVECISYERYIKDMQRFQNEQNTHLYKVTSDGDHQLISYDSVDADIIVFDTFEAYQQYIENLDNRIGHNDSDDKIYINNQFPAILRYDEECCCYKDWRKERERLKKLFKVYDAVVNFKD